MGAKVIATCGSDEKCEVAIKQGGADFAINYSKDDWIQKVKDFTNDEGVDVVYGEEFRLLVDTLKNNMLKSHSLPS